MYTISSIPGRWEEGRWWSGNYDIYQHSTNFTYSCQSTKIHPCDLELTLPEGEEDDRLDDEELEYGVVGAEQVLGGMVEEQQRVQRQTD